jgi:hypothetical protein
MDIQEHMTENERAAFALLWWVAGGSICQLIDAGV